MVMTKELMAPPSWLTRPIRVLVVGAGGNGGEAIDSLAQFSRALEALGGQPLEVTVVDDATVRDVNLVRQRFWAADVGQNKAVTLVNRYNLMLGLNWVGLPLRVEDALASGLLERPHLIITAVDLPSVRRWVSESKDFNQPYHQTLWLDLGNGRRNGQAILGIMGSTEFPTVEKHYPELATMPDDPSKSCSTAEAIASQDCLINRTVSTAGMNMVWELMRHGKTAKNGIVVDLASGMQMPIAFG